MARVLKDYVLPILFTVSMILNGWFLWSANVRYEQEKNQDIRIDKVESTICTKQEVKEAMSEVVKAELNSFELRLQEKYKIIPKK